MACGRNPRPPAPFLKHAGRAVEWARSRRGLPEECHKRQARKICRRESHPTLNRLCPLRLDWGRKNPPGANDRAAPLESLHTKQNISPVGFQVAGFRQQAGHPDDCYWLGPRPRSIRGLLMSARGCLNRYAGFDSHHFMERRHRDFLTPEARDFAHHVQPVTTLRLKINGSIAALVFRRVVQRLLSTRCAIGRCSAARAPSEFHSPTWIAARVLAERCQTRRKRRFWRTVINSDP